MSCECRPKLCARVLTPSIAVDEQPRRSRLSTSVLECSAAKPRRTVRVDVHPDDPPSKQSSTGARYSFPSQRGISVMSVSYFPPELFGVPIGLFDTVWTTFSPDHQSVLVAHAGYCAVRSVVGMTVFQRKVSAQICA